LVPDERSGEPVERSGTELCVKRGESGALYGEEVTATLDGEYALDELAEYGTDE
jgi:hypothetical protein